MYEFLSKLIDWITEQLEFVVAGFTILIFLLNNIDNSVTILFITILSKEDFSWQIVPTIIIGLFGIYVIGLFAAQISRLIINPISKYTFRPFFMTMTGNEGLNRKNWWRDRKEINGKYRGAFRRGYYYSRPEIRKEFHKRRQRSRIIRSFISPLLLYSSYFHNWLIIGSICYLVILIFYSYSESGIFDEATIAGN